MVAKYHNELRSRDQHISAMATKSYDLLIVGGGCNGAGVLLDAASRGMSCALVESNDFCSGTSSRSTKLGHGGIRYLDQMFKGQGSFWENYELIKEALAE